jgi:hypothetical protein
MVTSSSKQATFRPLSELLPKNEVGDAEFQHIVSVLLQSDVSQDGRQKQLVVPPVLVKGYDWLDAHCVYVGSHHRTMGMTMPDSSASLASTLRS